MNNTLFVEVKNNYGKDVIYPKCKTSRLLTDLWDGLIITDEKVKILKSLGYTFTQVLKEI